jgi:hypothetical protein
VGTLATVGTPARAKTQVIVGHKQQ